MLPSLALRFCAAVGALLLTAGCIDGYPSEDLPRTSALIPRDHVRALNKYLDDRERDDEPQFKLTTPCILTLLESTENADAIPHAIELESALFAQRADKEIGIFSVMISDDHDLSRSHEFAVGNWVDAVAFRSHLQQLRISCIEEFNRDSTR